VQEFPDGLSVFDAQPDQVATHRDARSRLGSRENTMSGTGRIRRWGTGLAATAVLMAVAPLGTAGADDHTTTTTVELVSGVRAPSSQLDAHTELSRDGGTTWEPAYVVTAHPNWHTIPGTGWVSTSRRGLDRSNQDTDFRRVFDLYGVDGDIGTVRVCLYADNAVSVSLNGVQLGAQPQGDHEPNYRGGETCYDYQGPLAAGANVLDFTVHDVGDYMALDHRAAVIYQELPNQAPVLALPDDLVVDATGADGAMVTYAASATDDRGHVDVVCTPPSGEVFAIGTTTVQCTATDANGATVEGSFGVTVRGAAEQLADLLAVVTGVGPGKSLAAKIRTALHDLSQACDPLADFLAEVHAQSSTHIPAGTAALLVDEATRIRAVLACS
jgi:hypothetical protein